MNAKSLVDRMFLNNKNVREEVDKVYFEKFELFYGTDERLKDYLK